MPALKNTKTWENLKEAFAGESQANRRYLYFAQKADVEGHNDVASVFRSRRRKAKPATPMAIWNIWRKWAIRPPASPSAPPTPT